MNVLQTQGLQKKKNTALEERIKERGQRKKNNKEKEKKKKEESTNLPIKKRKNGTVTVRTEIVVITFPCSQVYSNFLLFKCWPFDFSVFWPRCLVMFYKEIIFR